MKLIDLIEKQPFFGEIKNEIQNKTFFHASYVTSADDLFLDEFCTVLSCELIENGHADFSSADSVKVIAHSHPDVKEYGSSGKVLSEDTKEIIDNAYLSSMFSENKVFLLKNFDSATPQAQNKLLKILEDPPQNTFFILTSASTEKTLPTVLSRCKKIILPQLDRQDFASVYQTMTNKLLNDEVYITSAGKIGSAVKLSGDQSFMSNYQMALGTVINLKNSKEVLPFANALGKDKNLFLAKLDIMRTFYVDIMYIKANKESFVLNVSQTNVLKSIAKEFSLDAIIQILKLIDTAKQKFEANVNPLLLADRLLVDILEVKYLCKPKL